MIIMHLIIMYALFTHKLHSLEVCWPDAFIVSKHFMFFAFLCEGAANETGFYANMTYLVWVCVHVVSASVSVRMRLCECVVFVSVSTYVSHFSFITLWHLFTIARPNTIRRLTKARRTARGSVEKRRAPAITGLLFLWSVFSVAFAMFTRKYIYKVQLRSRRVCMCVCVTFVESLGLLALLAYLNNIYAYLTSLCALPNAVFGFPYKLSRTTTKCMENFKF